MPYINKEARERLKTATQTFEDIEMRSPGDLNYLLTLLVHRYLNQSPENYETYNSAIGALEGCKLELYRRHISEYEDRKIKENGDV